MALATLRQASGLRQLLPAAAQGLQLQQERGMQIFDLFSKEQRAKRKAKLKEEINRGYFDDFKEFRDSKGKAFTAPERLVPAAHALAFPSMELVQSDGRPAVFPPPSTAAAAAGDGGGGGGAAAAALQPAAASLVCLAFRAGAQPMLEAWARPWSERFAGQQGAVALFELALVEGVVMRTWPFRQILLRSGAAAARKYGYALPCRVLTRFGGGLEQLRSQLHLTNLLTAYIFLVDSQGRLRWRASGGPSEQELATLLRCTDELLAAEQKAATQQAQQAAAAAEQQQQQQHAAEQQLPAAEAPR